MRSVLIVSVLIVSSRIVSMRGGWGGYAPVDQPVEKVGVEAINLCLCDGPVEGVWR